MRGQLYLLACLGLLLAASGAAAQPPGQPLPGYPTGNAGNGFGQSPPSNSFNYLNLNRAGASPAVNYYSLVRPFNTIQNNFTNLQSQVNMVQGTVYDQQTGALGVVVNRPQFLNTTGYFLTYGLGAANGGHPVNLPLLTGNGMPPQAITPRPQVGAQPLFR